MLNQSTPVQGSGPGLPRTLFGRSANWLFGEREIDQAAPAVFTVCDTHYLDYAISLIRSADVFSPGSAIALHVVNPRSEDVARVQTVAASLEQTRLALSVERIDLSPLAPAQQRAYFASARFLRLVEVMGAVSMPVLSLDADSLIVAPIDNDFSDKTHAEVCLIRREQATEPHLAVANGSIWLRPTAGARAWLQSVATDLIDAFEQGRADWFVDQLATGRQVQAYGGRVGILNIKGKYADWNFGDNSIVWSGKGPRKAADQRFALLQRILLDAPRKQVVALRNALQAFPDRSSRMHGRIMQASSAVPARVALFLPRLDLPWGAAFQSMRIPPLLSDDALELRLHWKAFGARLANAIERKGVQVDMQELPAWQIDSEAVETSGADLALIPHRCHLDFQPGEVPVRYYMQEYFRWVFVIDERGWSAASSAYPMVPDRAPQTPQGLYDDYRARLAKGQLDSKFAQANSQPRSALEEAGQLPAGPYVFLPLQIPHDQSIRYFSAWSEQQVVQALLSWARQREITLVMKPHPANPRSMAEFEAMARGGGAHWSTAHVHDLIAHAQAVFTINSGVGFEALLHGVPVITFGRVEYDCVTFHATPETIDDAWERAMSCDKFQLEATYRRFVDAFLGHYAVDLSLPEVAHQRLEDIAQDIADAARAAHAAKIRVPSA